MYKANVGNFLEESADDLYENAPCGYVSTLPDGTIIKINQTLLSWTGYTRHEMVYLKKFQHMLSIGGKMLYETHHAPLLQMQGFVKELNYDILRKNLTKFPALVNSVEVKNKRGEVVLIRSTIVDITERKKYETELLKAKKKAEEATRVKAEFLSTISHEIRTPMNAVIGITNLLMDTHLGREQQELVGMLKSSSAHLLNLINDVLDFSKIESGKMVLEEKNFHLQELLSGILYSLQVKADEKKLALSLHLDEKLPLHLTGDPVKISQILTNLIGNALKFTSEGSVTVAIQLRETGQDFALMDFSVKDTGIGIALDKQDHIFEEFSQAGSDISRRYGGTGLGLSISRKLLELHGSTLAVRSQPGTGSEFYFTLRVRLAKTPVQPASATEQTVAATRSLKGIKLLVAEDNEVNVMVLSQFLKKWDVAFDVVPNGAVAVDKITHTPYDLVLMDLQMPVMDGYEASSKIRRLAGELYKQLPIIALSASSRLEIQDKILAAGMTDFIGKPFNPHELFQAIAAHVLPKPEAAASVTDTSCLAADPGSVETQENNSPVSLKQFIEITGPDNPEFYRLIKLSIHSFLLYKTEFTEALLTRNLGLLEGLAHKSRMTLTMLGAKKMLDLIGQSRKLLEENAAANTVDQMALALATELELITAELKKSLPPVTK